MAAQPGRNVLVKIGDGGSPEVFSTVCGIRTKSISLSENLVDITDSCSVGQFRELLQGAGTKQATITGSGIFKDTAGEELVRSNWFNSSQSNYQFVIPDFGTMEGAFLVTSIEYGGDHDGEATFSWTFESAGPVTWTAA